MIEEISGKFFNGTEYFSTFSSFSWAFVLSLCQIETKRDRYGSYKKNHAI